MRPASAATLLRRWLHFVDTRSDRAVALALVALGLVLATPGLLTESDPSVDAFFYEANALRVGGMERDAALRQTLSSPRADGIVGPWATDEWVAYNSLFFDRRWLVPASGWAVAEVSGASLHRSLQTVSMLAFALVALAVFVLLRQGFGRGESATAAVLCLLFPPLWTWSHTELSDSWGLVFETFGLAFLLLVVRSGPRWLAGWLVCVLALSFTRDATPILALALLAVLIGRRGDRVIRQRCFVLMGVGAAAALPAFGVASARLRENLAWVIEGYDVPARDDWGHVASHYPSQLLETIEQNLTWPLAHGPIGPLLYPVLGLGVAMVLVVVFRREAQEPLWLALRGAALGALLLVLLAANPQGYRYELAFLPVVACGLAWLLARARVAAPSTA